MDRHMFLMVVACAVPLVLIFILYLFNIKNDFIYWLGLIVMVVLHFWMMRGHQHQDAKMKKKVF